jgi:spermidine synthase
VEENSFPTSHAFYLIGSFLRGRKRAIYALLAPVLLVVLWHHLALQVGSGYLLHHVVLKPFWPWISHLVGLFMGMAWIFQKPLIPRTWLVWAGSMFGLAAGMIHIAAFFCFASTQAFQVFALVAPFVFGLSVGTYAACLIRLLPLIVYPKARLLDALSLEGVALFLVFGGVVFALAHRAGGLRATIGISLISNLFAYQSAGFVPIQNRQVQYSRSMAALSTFALLLAVIATEPLTPWWEANQVPDPIVFANNSPHGRIVLTSGRDAYQFYVEGTMRFSSIDSYRLRETMIHPMMIAAKTHQRVLVIGGAEGLGVREILRYPDVQEVVVVEPDAILLNVAKSQPIMRFENGNAFDDKRVKVVVDDPVHWLKSHNDTFDAILIDGMEPITPERSKIFTSYFYGLVRDHLKEAGVGSVNGSTPFALRKAFWCIVRTLEAAKLSTLPYRAELPTLGPWGQVLFAKQKIEKPTHVSIPNLKYLDDASLQNLFDLAEDEGPVEVEVNRMYHQAFVAYRNPKAATKATQPRLR